MSNFKNSIVFLLGVCFAGQISASGPINRNIPFCSEVANDVGYAGVSGSLFATYSSFEFEPLDRHPKAYKPFDGLELDLKDLDEANALFTSQSGLLTKDYFPGNGYSGMSQYKGQPLKIEVYQTTKMTGSNLSFAKKWNDLFEFSPELKSSSYKLSSFLNGLNVFVGANLPFFRAHRVATYEPEYLKRFVNNRRGQEGAALNQRIKEKLSEFADDFGLNINHWSQSGLGDLSVYLGAGSKMDYVFSCRSVELSAAGLVNVPTGNTFDIDNPLSFSFGRNAFSYGLNLAAKLELKRGLKVGGSVAWETGNKSKMLRRMPIKNEPNGWSPVKETLILSSGSTFSIAPYVVFENFMDWNLDCKVGFSYVKAGKDLWTDPRNNPVVRPFMQNPDSTLTVRRRLEASEWDAKYLHVKISYDPSAGASDSMAYSPVFWASYDNPWEREEDYKISRFSVGATLSF